MLNVLITGANGQLGSEIRQLSSEYNYRFFFTTKDELDITNQALLETYIQNNSIEAIINCAAYTAVDKAEEEYALANSINHIAVENIGKVCKAKSIKLIHLSTDYVFDGMNFKPYVEDDKTNPSGVYGKTKLDGELALQNLRLRDTIIIRTSWVYSSFGSNFVKTMLRLGKERDSLGVIFDQVGTPTYARDLARATLEILPNIENDKTGIYHYSNEGVLSWYDFAKEIMDMAGLVCEVKPIETKSYPTPAKRPHYSLMNKAKIKERYEIEIPYWKASLKKCLKIMGECK